MVGAAVGVCCLPKIEAPAVCKCHQRGRSALVFGTAEPAPKMEAISSSHPIDFTLKSGVNNNNLDDSYIYQRHSSPSSSPNASRSPSPAPPIKSAPTGLNLLIGKPSSNSSAFRIVTPKGKNEGECKF